MTTQRKYTEMERWYYKGYRLNPETETLFVNERHQDDFVVPPELKHYQVELFDPEEYLNSRLEPMRMLTEKMNKKGHAAGTIDGLTQKLTDEFYWLLGLDDSSSKKRLYSYNEYGDIRMLVYDIMGDVVQIMKNNRPEEIENRIKTRGKNPASFLTLSSEKYRVRLNPMYQQAMLPDQKYDFTSTDGTPFFDPYCMYLFYSNIPIETLIITEGQFKAAVANRIGLPVIGLSSITHWRDNNTNGLHYDIFRFIWKTRPKNIILLWDGDCLNQAKSQKAPYNTRPYLFYRMAFTIIAHLKMNTLMLFRTTQLYFAKIKTDRLKLKPKGLDDLILAYSEDEHLNRITNDLEGCNTGSPYVEMINVTEETNLKLQQFFSMDQVDPYSITQINQYIKMNRNKNIK